MTSPRVDFDAVTAIMRDVAEETILPRFRNLGTDDIAFKVGDDPVTIADKEAESALSTRLSGLLPGSKTMGEEAFAANPSILEVISGESPVWIIDPIDGTRNFVRGSTSFGVIIALVQQNQTLAGWIYHPTSGEVVTAEKGAGAWYQGRKLKVLPAAPLMTMVGALGDRLIEAYDKVNAPKPLPDVFEQTYVSCTEYPRLVVGGPHFGDDRPQIHLRASLSYTTPWDDTAGVLMHSEAGGYGAYWDGTPFLPSGMHRGYASAPDPDSWQELRTWVRGFTDLP